MSAPQRGIYGAAMQRPKPLRQDQLDGLIAFSVLARTLNFRAAARELGISPSAMSHAIRSLEDRLGVALFARTTRQVGLTEAGVRFCQALLPALDGIADAIGAIELLATEVSGELRLNVPIAVAPKLVADIVVPFMAKYPDVHVEVHASDSFDPVFQDGFDVGVRFGETLDPDAVAIRLTEPFPIGCYGSPAYIGSRGEPVAPGDLDCHACVGFRGADGHVQPWNLIVDGEHRDFTVAGGLTVSDATSNIAAGVAGAGLIHAAAPLAEHFVSSGALVPVLGPYWPMTSGLFIYYSGRRQKLAKLAALIAFVMARTAQSAAVIPPSTNTADPVR